MSIFLIRNCAQTIKFSSHAKEEMLYEEYGVIREEEINEKEMKCVLCGGKIIEKMVTEEV